MKNKAPGRAGQGRQAVNLKCDYCLFLSRFFQMYQAACRLILLQAFIGPDFEPDLSLRLDAALQDLEALEGRRRGEPVPVGLIVGREMADLDRRRLDSEYLGERH